MFFFHIFSIQPEFRSNWGFGVLLKDTSTQPGRNWTGYPPTAKWLLLPSEPMLPPTKRQLVVLPRNGHLPASCFFSHCSRKPRKRKAGWRRPIHTRVQRQLATGAQTASRSDEQCYISTDCIPPTCEANGRVTPKCHSLRLRCSLMRHKRHFYWVSYLAAPRKDHVMTLYGYGKSLRLWIKERVKVDAQTGHRAALSVNVDNKTAERLMINSICSRQTKYTY